MSKNILFVVEGERSEPRFLKRLVTVMRTYDSYDVYSYRTNIHKMLDGMFVGDEIDSDLDFLEYLRSLKNDEEQMNMLNRSFSDIFLFFDMDPQDQKHDRERLEKAAQYFDDSTNNGKLYLNYPMLESFRHISNLDDLSYLDVKVKKDDIRRYKEIVNREGLSSLSDISKIDETMMLKIIALNLRKANLLVTGNGSIPDPTSYENEITQTAILTKEYQSFFNKDELPVLNTCVFNTVDYSPERFFDKINELKISDLVM